MEVFGELMLRDPGILERPLKELVPISFVGSAAVSAYRSLISKLDTLPMSEEQKAKTLRDGQDAGKMLLAIEARIGELSYAEPRIPPIGAGRGTRASGEPPKHERLGLKRDQMKAAQTIAANPEAVEAVIREAEENEDIPTKTAVINKVRYERERKWREEADKREKPQIVINLEQSKYINILEWIIEKLPRTPPKEWNDKAFARAQGLAQIIINRLEVFNGKERRNITE